MWVSLSSHYPHHYWLRNQQWRVLPWWYSSGYRKASLLRSYLLTYLAQALPAMSWEFHQPSCSGHHGYMHLQSRTPTPVNTPRSQCQQACQTAQLRLHLTELMSPCDALSFRFCAYNHPRHPWSPHATLTSHILDQQARLECLCRIGPPHHPWMFWGLRRTIDRRSSSKVPQFW